MPQLGPLAVAGALAVAILARAGGAPAGPIDAPGYAKAFACSACHGLGGNSRADAMPVLAAMAPAYFRKAIEDYAAGRRPSAEMEPFAKLVLTLGVDEVAAYFAAQGREPWPVAADPAAAARGRSAAAACAVCHGASGQGDPAKTIPRLAGQPPGYLRRQMALFKAETRSPGDERLRAMKAIMRELSEAQIDDLAAFFSSQR